MASPCGPISSSLLDAGLVGLAFAPDLPPGRVLLAFVPLFLSYGFGQALTDCFQIDTDAVSAPYRPLVRGIVSGPRSSRSAWPD